MSTFDDEPELRQAGPSFLHIEKPKVKLTRNSKGDPQWEISAVEGATDATLDHLRAMAMRQWFAFEQELLGLER